MKQRFIFGALALGLCGGLSTVDAKDRMTHNPDATNTDAILHAWSWNFPTIAENMAKIAEAGFTMVQTSPVQGC